MVKLFVSGFPLDINEMELAQLIGSHGTIATIKIVRDKQTRKCKGYAFVEMESQMDAENAVIALDGVTMRDRELTVKINEEKPVVVAPKYNRVMPGRQENRSTLTSEEQKNKRPRRPRV